MSECGGRGQRSAGAASCPERAQPAKQITLLEMERKLVRLERNDRKAAPVAGEQGGSDVGWFSRGYQCAAVAGHA